MFTRYLRNLLLIGLFPGSSKVNTMSELNWLKELWNEVNWTEPWLICLLVFHVCTFLVILLLRNHVYVLACILSVLGILCVATESVNEYAATHYRKFALQQYFDSSGVFILTVYAAPMLFNCTIILVCFLYQVWVTMVKVGVLKAQRNVKQGHKKKQ